MFSNPKQLLFIGGHHTSAIAVIAALNKQAGVNNNLRYYWVGHRHSMWGDTNDSAEYKEVVSLGLPFFDLKAGKFYRTFNPLKLLRIPWGFIQAFYYLLKIRPQLIMSFGGYLAVPVVIDAWVLGIPVITHEQTVVSGWANKLVARFAKEVLISWPQSLSEFPPEKVRITGLPLRQELISTALQNDIAEPDLIYVTGGKQGSHTLNQVFYGVIPTLLKTYKIIYQCGQNSIHKDLERFINLKKTMNPDLATRFEVSDFYNSEALATIYKKSTLVVSRSGAHTVYELLALGKPSLLVPLPFASHNEQYLNASLVKQIGLGEILNQADLTGEKLVETITKMMENISIFQRHAGTARGLIIYDAAEKIAAEIRAILE